jgi:c-di-AMP phosphodiesterase-like protein
MFIVCSCIHHIVNKIKRKIIYSFTHTDIVSLGSAVGIATGYGLEDRGIGV